MTSIRFHLLIDGVGRRDPREGVRIGNQLRGCPLRWARVAQRATDSSSRGGCTAKTGRVDHAQEGLESGHFSLEQ
jgi:hypothetical protein